MKFILFILLFNLSSNIFSQSKSDLTSFFKLDTIIDSKIKIDYSNFIDDSYISYVDKNKLLIYNPSFNDNDTLEFININLKNYNQSKLYVKIKKLSQIIDNPNLKSIALRDSLLAIYSVNENLILYNLNSEKLIFNKLLGEAGYCPFEKIDFISDNELVFYKTYNSHPKSCGTDILIKTFDLKNKSFKNQYKFNNFDKEFSHILPNKWVCSNKLGTTLYTKSTEYKFYELNSELKIVDSISFNDSNWVKIPKNYFNNFYKLNKEYNPKNLIEFIRPINEKISRIEKINYLNDSTLIISKIPKNQNNNNSPRLHDIWIKVNNKWEISKYNIIEPKVELTEKLFKEKYPLYTSNTYNNFIKDNYYINIVPNNIDNIYSFSNSEIEKLLEKNGADKLTYKIFIFKYNK